jgi:peptidoglycan biosynthesis protein MviN/MurJ (putative lipid II flippase)
VFAIALNVFLAVTLARPSAYGVAGLALAQSIVAMTEVTILFTIMLFRDHKIFFSRYFWGGLWRIVSVTGFSVVAAFIMISFYPLGANNRGFITLGSKLALISAVTFAVHIAVSALFDLDEVQPIFRWIRRLLFKPVDLEF